MSKMEIAIMKHAHNAEEGGAGRNWAKLALGLAGVAAGLFLAWRLGAFDLLSVANIDRLDAWFAGLGFGRRWFLFSCGSWQPCSSSPVSRSRSWAG